MLKQSILTKTEQEVINRRLNNEKLTKQDSYYLSVSIRPKLKQMASIDAKQLLQKLEYNQKSISIEKKITKFILQEIKDVKAIILYGSAIQTNYSEYNDIDIMIVTELKISPEIEKYKKIKELKEILKINSIVSDIEIISKDNLIKSYKNSPTLIYQLKDCKIIYGKIEIPNKIEIYNIDLRIKLNWSDIEDIKPNGKEIYSALRNVILVRLLLNKIIDNTKLKESLYDELGKNIIENLKNNKQSKEEEKYVLNYLKNLVNDTRKQIKGGLWEKIDI